MFALSVVFCLRFLIFFVHTFTKFAHIVCMGRFFLPLSVVFAAAGLLFVPIVTELSVHADVNRKKFAFSIYAYRAIKLIGGYVTAYPGGVALHVSPRKAILLPYSKMESERKRFSFVRSFRLISVSVTTETGAEYLIPAAIAHTALKTLFYSLGGEKEKTELWLTDGDTLKTSANLAVWFNLFMLLTVFLKFLKEKLKYLWRKKAKKSIG